MGSLLIVFASASSKDHANRSDRTFVRPKHQFELDSDTDNSTTSANPDNGNSNDFNQTTDSGICSHGDTLCLDVGPRSLLTNVRTGLIDPDTPKSARKKVSADGTEWALVVSLLYVCSGLMLIADSSPMNSTRKGGHFTRMTTLTSKVRICGMESLRISRYYFLFHPSLNRARIDISYIYSGMIPTQSQPDLEHWRSGSTPSPTTDSTIAPECSNHGTDYVSPAAVWRQASLFPEEPMYPAFGPVSGQWEILLVLGMQQHPMECGRIATMMDVMRASCRIRVSRMG